MKDRILGEVDFLDGSRRLVYEGPEERQYVLGDDGNPVHGVWMPPADEPTQVRLIEK